MQPVKMTRAEYLAKYGVAPGASSATPVASTPVAPPSTPVPASAPTSDVSTPVKMTRAEYTAKYGTSPDSTSTPVDNGNPIVNFAKGIVSAPATMVARPFQLAQTLASGQIGATSKLEDINKQMADINAYNEPILKQLYAARAAGQDTTQFAKQLKQIPPELLAQSTEAAKTASFQPYSNSVIAPAPQNGSDLVKDVGRAAQTVALGVGAPLASGALFGAGASLENQGTNAFTTPEGITQTIASTLIGMGGGKLLDSVGKPFVNAAGKVIGTVTPKLIKDLTAKGGTAVADFMAQHEIVPAAVKPVINAIPKVAETIDNTINQKTSQLFQGAKNTASDLVSSQYPGLKDTFQKNLNDAEQSIYPTLTKNEKANVQLKDKATIFGNKAVPDLQNNPSTKPIIEAVANLPEDIKLKPSDTVTVKDSKLTQGINRLHQDTANNLAEPKIKASTTFTPKQYDTFMKQNVLDPIESEFGKTSKEYVTALKGIETSKKSITENNAFGSHSGRQNFDTQFKKENPRAFKLQKTLFGQLDPNVTTTIETGRAIRNAMNDFTESLLPANHPYRARLREESNLLKALEEMRKRSTAQLNKNGLTRALDRNPTVKKTVKTGASLLKLGTIGSFIK